jgi:hypothetical protein
MGNYILVIGRIRFWTVVFNFFSGRGCLAGAANILSAGRLENVLGLRDLLRIIRVNGD